MELLGVVVARNLVFLVAMVRGYLVSLDCLELGSVVARIPLFWL